MDPINRTKEFKSKRVEGHLIIDPAKEKFPTISTIMMNTRKKVFMSQHTTNSKYLRCNSGKISITDGSQSTKIIKNGQSSQITNEIAKIIRVVKDGTEIYQ